jgi:hypothetical protein
MPVEWALGCFVRFWEVDRGIPVTAMGATSTWPNLAESGMAGLDEPRAEAAFISDGRPVTLESENTLAMAQESICDVKFAKTPRKV